MSFNSSLPIASAIESIPTSLFDSVGQLFNSEFVSNNIRPSHVALSVLFALSAAQYLGIKRREVNAPSAGSYGWLLSFIEAKEWYENSRKLIQEATEKFKGKTFKIPQYDRWVVVVSSPKLIDELRRAPDDVLSFTHANDEIFSAKHTFGGLTTGDHRAIPVVRQKLTQNISNIFDGVFEEISQGYTDFIDAKGDEWVTRYAMHVVARVVFRASNRVFVGLPLCRNDVFMGINVQHALDVVNVANSIKPYPFFMKPFVARFTTNLPATSKHASELLRPLIEERLKHSGQSEDEWPDKPNDLLQWFIDETEPEKRNVMRHTYDILALNFAAIHTSSNTMSDALYHLAARPEFVAPLREEVEKVVAEEGWSKASMQKLRKIDSFLRETLRYRGIDFLTMRRKVLKDYTLSDGTHLPKGTLVAVNSHAVHHNSELYDNPNEFQPFRYSSIRDQSLEESTRNQMVATASSYIGFGHGKHACPGRFFAANELKAMLAYVVLNYDLKLPDGEQKEITFESELRGPIMFRKRQL
ncbi:cytochrome P450 [Pyrrhoderma noxium]|uniref:Cytochrome P450 n=1 Tax=Pyrrhoderma noxium TaxID=2282107 RepID=A0A286U749_9AGAM|nr:cytochrome P450 [Pyrrhoderma noxium]